MSLDQAVDMLKLVYRIETLERAIAMTEEQIERRVEKMTDALDRWLIAGEMSQREYDWAMADLAIWADHEYRRMSDAEA